MSFAYVIAEKKYQYLRPKPSPTPVTLLKGFYLRNRGGGCVWKSISLLSGIAIIPSTQNVTTVDTTEWVSRHVARDARGVKKFPLPLLRNGRADWAETRYAAIQPSDDAVRWKS